MLPKAIPNSERETNPRVASIHASKTLLPKKFPSITFSRKVGYTNHHHYVRNKNSSSKRFTTVFVKMVALHPSHHPWSNPKNSPATHATNTPFSYTKRKKKLATKAITSILYPMLLGHKSIISKIWHRVETLGCPPGFQEKLSQAPPAKGCFLPGCVRIQMVGCS